MFNSHIAAMPQLLNHSNSDKDTVMEWISMRWPVGWDHMAARTAPAMSAEVSDGGLKGNKTLFV